MRASAGLWDLVLLRMFASLPFVPSCSDDTRERTAGGYCPQPTDTGQGRLPAVVTREDADSVTISKGSLSILVWKEPFGWRCAAKERGVVAESYAFGTDHSFFYIREGRTSRLSHYKHWQKISGGAALTYETSEGADAVISLSFHTAQTIRVTADLGATSGSPQLVQDVRLFPEEAIYGLMERIDADQYLSEIEPQEIGSIDRRGEIAPMWILPTIGVYTPFYHSSNGYGLYVDTTLPGEFDVGRSVTDRLRFRFETPQGGEPALSYFLFCGPTHDGILDEYTGLTGRPFIPPPWAFKHFRWRDELSYGRAPLDDHMINAQVAEDVSYYEQLGIPAGNYLFDRPWTPGQEGFAEFAWDPLRLPNAGAMLRSLLERGYHVMTWAGPWAIGTRPWQNGSEATRGDYYAPESNRYIDFTNPAAYQWWKDKVKRFVLENHVHGWKLDRADEDHPSLPSQRYYNGLTGRELHNAYCLSYQRCFFEAMKEAWGDDFVNMARAGWSGSQKYAVLWGGDTRGAVGVFDCRSTDLGLRSVIIAQLNAAFMGFPIWGSDTGGYQEFRDREVFARWLEFSAFCPLMEIGGVGAHAPWDMPTRPRYDSELIAIYRTYAKLHHELAPYTHAHAVMSGLDGRAIVRPLVFDHPDDPVVGSMGDEYCLGKAPLAAPVWQAGARQRRVSIPSGTFLDYRDPHLVITGPQALVADVPLERIPLYVRKGATVFGRFW